jgi:hypothetical protein
MTSNSTPLDLSISKCKPGFPYPYYQEQLKAFWTEVKRSAIYEYDTIHGVNCICCSKIRILQIGNDTIRIPKSKMRMGRKPGSGDHNQK